MLYFTFLIILFSIVSCQKTDETNIANKAYSKEQLKKIFTTETDESIEKLNIDFDELINKLLLQQKLRSCLLKEYTI